MSINSALHIGRTALLTSQTALQVAGDNMANAATRGFHRRTIHLAPSQGHHLGAGQFIGQGVSLKSIRREIDGALQIRYRAAISREHASYVDQQFLTAMETLQNELTDNDVSTMLSSFFNSFSELANSPSDNAVRGVVIQKGQSLATRLAAMRNDYNTVLTQINQSLDVSVTKVNDILGQVTQLNTQIAAAESSGGGGAASLRDHRDLLLDELAQYLDITVVEQPNGAADVLVGSIPIVLGGESRGIKIQSDMVNGKAVLSLRVAADGTHLSANAGSIGSLLNQRAQTVEPMIKALDDFTSQLIFQVNRVHSQGQGLKGFESVSGTYKAHSPSVNLNSPESKLPFKIQNGSFYIHVTNKETGVRTTHEISVNGNTMSLNDLVAEINTVVGVPHVTAAVGVEGGGNVLKLTADAGYEFSFSDDTSGALAALGINTFFTGHNASTIGVNQRLIDDPGLLAAGGGHVEGSTDTAILLANLQDVAFSELGGKSLREFWRNAASNLAVKTGAANASADTSRLVRESLGAQIQSVSGVSLDEEAINLLTFQRQFQAAARFIGVIDETMQTLIALV
ncbi:MAG TPA: flagellar hook-associated protein FlgK [Phycisphaerales bacterium]|nr:flagellar hook-associated protein FlgK [Phycisphaerales bacterium]HRQ76193.1 flagellar hook-associated protein FlgK [Phycisphaerales bacterium]